MKIKTFVFNPFQENTYVIYDETKEAAIIDAGCLFDAEKEQLKHFIDENELIVRRVLNTHLHLDHIFGNNFVFETYAVKPEASIKDEFLIQAFAASIRAFGLPIEGKAQPIGSYIEENQEVSFGNIKLKTFPVPGHSPGSIAFYNEKEGVVFTGDALFQNSIGRTDLQGGDHATLIRSIQQNLFTLPDSTVVYSGHGPTTTIGEEKKHNPYL